MAELSPAAQAVRSAYHKICEDYIETWLNFSHNRGLAAALRAAVDYTKVNPGRDMWQCDANELLAIADELETQP